MMQKQTFNAMFCLAIVLEDITAIPSLHLLIGVTRRSWWGNLFLMSYYQRARIPFDFLFNLDQFTYFRHTIFYLQDVQTWFLS